KLIKVDDLSLLRQIPATDGDISAATTAHNHRCFRRRQTHQWRTSIRKSMSFIRSMISSWSKIRRGRKAVPPVVAIKDKP
ncbi:hypothetical protein ACLOJK_015237, partial [Asimina triloba]